MFDTFVRKRITELRLRKGVSEYQMSLDLGHGKNYVQSISSGRMLPALSELPYICEYLGVSVHDFFDDTMRYPELMREIICHAQKLDDKGLRAIIAVMERIEIHK